MLPANWRLLPTSLCHLNRCKKGRPLHSARRHLFGQAEMHTVVVLITRLLLHAPFQVAFVEDDHMVEQIAAAVADEALGHTVLPGTLEGA